MNESFAIMVYCWKGLDVMLCVMWNLFTVGSLQFPDDSTIASLEANQNRPKIKNHVNK